MVEEVKKSEDKYALKNEAGAPNYPKIITNKSGAREIVNNPDEEKEKAATEADLKKGWGK